MAPVAMPLSETPTLLASAFTACEAIPMVDLIDDGLSMFTPWRTVIELLA